MLSGIRKPAREAGAFDRGGDGISRSSDWETAEPEFQPTCLGLQDSMLLTTACYWVFIQGSRIQLSHICPPHSPTIWFLD